MAHRSQDRRYTSDPGKCLRRSARSAPARLRGFAPPSFGLKQRPAQGRQCGTVFTLHIKTLASVRDRAHEHGFVRPKIITRIGLTKLLAVRSLDWTNVEYG